MATDEIRLPADGVFLGRAFAEGWAHPAIVTVRDGMVVDITSKAAPTSRDVCEQPDPAGYVTKADGRPVGSLTEIAKNSFSATAPTNRKGDRTWAGRHTLLPACN